MSKQQILDSKISEEIVKVKCEICGKEFQKITNSHLKKHDITINEYIEQFPGAFLITESCRKKFSGENNGMYGKHQTEESKQKSREAHLGRHHTDEAKQKMSDSRSGEKNHFYGKHHTEEAKQSIGKAHLGKPSHMKGKHPSEETKQKMREPISEEGKKNMRKPKSEEHKQKIREFHLGMKASEEAKLKMSKSRLGEKNGSWKGGISFFPYCEKFDDDLKERIRNFFGRCCYVCGKNETDNGRKLDVHHVNYDKMVCCNDVKPLFVPLCMSCHAKTLKDREYWEVFFTVSLNYLTNGECFIPKEVNKN